MAGLNQSIAQTLVLTSPVLLAQGTTVDLAPGQVGIFDGESYEATVNPTYAKNKALIIAQGRNELTNLNGLLLTGFDSESFKTKLIKGKKILGWTGKRASRGKKEIITVGFDGGDITKNLSGVDSINKHFYLKLTGNPITQMYSSDGIIRQYIVDGNTCLECPGGESNPEYIADQLVAKINGDKYVNKYVLASKLLYTPSPVVVDTTDFTQYTVAVTDNGDAQALTNVAVQYPTAVVKRVGRSGFVSTYELVQLASLAAPTAVSVNQSIVIPDCDTCPAGYTFVAAQTVYTIERPVAPGTDLTTSAARQTYANTFGTAYAATGRSVATLGGVNGSGYTNGTYAITGTGGGGTGFAGTITVTGGAITTRTITNPGIGYTSAPTIALPAGIGAGTLGTITATITAAPTTTSTFVSNDGGSVIVNVVVPGNVGDLSVLGSDNFVAVNTQGAVCTPPAPTTVAWVAGDTLLAYEKVIKITVADDCGDDVLEKIQAAYPDLTITLVAGTPTGNCVHVYQTTILSAPVASDCSIGEVKYTMPQAYKGIDWVEPKVDPVDAVEGLVAGVRIEDIYTPRTVDELTLDYFAHEYDGVHIEASYYNPDYNGDPCDVTEWPVTKIQGIEYPHGDGLMVRMREQRQLSLELRERSINPGVREAEGYVTNSRLDKFYDEYSLTFEFEYGVLGWSNKYTDTYRLTFFVEEGQGKALEAAINSYIVSTNVGLDPVVL
jgi:hypothetical protein